jgi:hypothetical protein
VGEALRIVKYAAKGDVLAYPLEDLQQ